MKAKAIAITAAIGITALGWMSPPANAAGCLKGALIGGLAGHFAGHGVLGAGAGCLVGRHYASRSAGQQMTQTQTRTVTRQYDTTRSRTNDGNPECDRGPDEAAAERGNRLRLLLP